MNLEPNLAVQCFHDEATENKLANQNKTTIQNLNPQSSQIIPSMLSSEYFLLAWMIERFIHEVGTSLIFNTPSSRWMALLMIWVLFF